VLALVVASSVRRGETPSSLGFSWKTFRPAVRALWPPVAACSGAIAIAGIATHSIRDVSLKFAAGGLFLYCFWGLFQQYLLNGFVVNRLAGAALRRSAPLLAAIIFSLVHLPNLFLVAIALIAGYLSAWAYLRYRNLFVLGLAHGLLGFLLYLAVPDSISHHLYVGPKCISYCRAQVQTANTTAAKIFNPAAW
jgi:hypothetical protein